MATIHLTWQAEEARRETAHAQQTTNTAAAEIGERLVAAERATGTLAEAARAVLDTEERASLEAVGAAVFAEAPAWIDALAVLPVQSSSKEPWVAQGRSPSLEARPRSADVRALVQEVADTASPKLTLLPDGRIALALPVVDLAVTRAVAVALLAREHLFAVTGAPAYRVQDAEGNTVFERDGRRPLPPEDVPGYVRPIRQGDAPWTLEVHPTALDHGPLRWVVVGGGAGMLLLLAGWLVVESRRRTEADANARLYRTLFEVASDLVFVVDEDLRFARANSEAERLFEIWEDQDYGGPFVDKLLEGEQPMAREALESARRGRCSRFMARVARRPGVLYEFRTAPILINDELVGVQVLAADVTQRERDRQQLAESRRQLERHRDELYRASITDPLTGVFNRRHLGARASEEVERARRYGRDLTCLFLDLDHFKIINDTWGHGVGDAVLKTFSALLRNNFRRTDIIGRYGGEEFVVLLTETPESQVYPTAQKILRIVRETHFPGVPDDHAVTVSIGAAVLDGTTASTPEGLFAAADEALYAAKNGGRDRLVLYKPLAA
ncbi:MAG: sensor domain-containing diguanylate cyclase [Myxococcota bacterium]